MEITITVRIMESSVRAFPTSPQPRLLHIELASTGNVEPGPPNSLGENCLAPSPLYHIQQRSSFKGETMN